MSEPKPPSWRRWINEHRLATAIIILAAIGYVNFVIDNISQSPAVSTGAQANTSPELTAQAEKEWQASKAGQICGPHPDWARTACVHIAAGEAAIGMTPEQARAAWGVPQDINSTITTHGTHEQWVYGGRSYLYFDNDVLSSIQN
jgi:hypothetical protein